MMKQMLRFGLLVLATVAVTAAAEVRLPRLFSDHMVVQRGAEIPVWGWAEKGAKVVVELAGHRAEAVADAAGCWSVRLAPLPAGGPYTLAVTDGGKTLTVSDVLVGEVWVASGQSWMTWDVARVDNAAEEIKVADYPQIRMFNVPQTEALTPEADCGGAWAVCSPQTVRSFSGCGYFFARRLHQELGVPVGILHASVPGTGLWAWSSRDVFVEDPDLRKRLDAFEAAIKRRKWGQGDRPFLFVQRPNLKETVSGANQLPEFRDAQTSALALPNTGMAVAIDIGLPDDLHPTNMQEAGRRLALLAEATIDGHTVLVASPQVPEPVSVRYAWAANPTCNLGNKEGLPAAPFRHSLVDPQTQPNTK